MTDRAVEMVRVWDLPTRLFHWLLVAVVVFELTTGLLAPKWWFGRHIWCGYALAVLLAFRIVWAFHGAKFSRLSAFLYSPRQAIEHLRGMARGRPIHYFGHNPAGAMMIYVLIAVLSLMVLTGLVVQGGDLKQGPLAGFTSFAVGEAVRAIHQFLAYLLLVLIGGHLAGVLLGSAIFKERLISAMIDGRKPVGAGEVVASSGSRPVRASAWLAALAIAGGALLAFLWERPALGVPNMPSNATFEQECSACHNVFHPSLLPRTSWAAIMADLPHHFGEDASLPVIRRDEIASYLESYAAEAWDTLPARRFSQVSSDDPLRITATPGWIRLHRHVDAAAFALSAVRSKTNCLACHRDAEGGQFAPQSIAIPAG
ncbi:MAG TPA: cytochrome b/b6 domain-containing protein [Candidatus Polarisedimenticolia bacterium]|nr:cytochrome b/b6 domain-containing protein [Candidatus Polarisedimenticolia bacterium]